MSVVDARVRLPQDLRPAPPDPADPLLGDYARVFGFHPGWPASAEDLLAALDRAGARAVVHAEQETGEDAEELNEATAAFVAAHPGRLAGVGTVTLQPPDVPRMLRQLDRIAELGLRGVNVQPAFAGLDLDAPALLPVYAKAMELGLVVALHTGVNYARRRPIAHERPERLDAVLALLPDLQVVACHAGWPWAAEMAAVARRHPTLHLDFGGVHPRYLAHPGGGWDVLLHFADTLLRDQVLFASDWPVVDPGAALEQWQVLPVRQATLDAALGANAERLFGLVPAEAAA